MTRPGSTEFLLYKMIEDRMPTFKVSRGRAIVIDKKTGKPKARPSGMSASATIAKRKAAGKPRLTKRNKGAQKP